MFSLLFAPGPTSYHAKTFAVDRLLRLPPRRARHGHLPIETRPFTHALNRPSTITAPQERLGRRDHDAVCKSGGSALTFSSADAAAPRGDSRPSAPCANTFRLVPVEKSC